MSFIIFSYLYIFKNCFLAINKDKKNVMYFLIFNEITKYEINIKTELYLMMNYILIIYIYIINHFLSIHYYILYYLMLLIILRYARVNLALMEIFIFIQCTISKRRPQLGPARHR